MILIISTCKEKLHELEFVKPIEDILNSNNIKYKVVNYKNIAFKDIEKSDKIIISGTSLKDNDFLNYIYKFNFIKSTNKPILGICAGMHLIGFVFKGKIKKYSQIGLIDMNFEKPFLNLSKGDFIGGYNLHNYYIDFSNIEEFIICSKKEVNQAVKHKDNEIYATLFHPEVRNKDIIKSFALANNI